VHFSSKGCVTVVVVVVVVVELKTVGLNRGATAHYGTVGRC